MAERSSADITIKFTDGTGTEGAGGSLSALSGVLSLNGINVEQLTEEGYAFGDAYVFFDPVGIDRVGDVQMTMFFDDTATTGNFDLFATGARTRTLAIEYGGTTPNILQQKFDVVIQRVNVAVQKGEKVKLEITLQPGSAMTTSRV